jgi:transposase
MIIVGIDWARSKHDLILIHQSGEVIHRMQVTHDAQGLDAIAAAIAEHEPHPDRVRIAIEMHDGALLCWLLQQGYTVFGINPKSAQRARDRYRPAGGKDDASDAFILADMLRTDRGTLRAVQPGSERTIELRSLVKLRAARVHERTALFHRLRCRLEEWCPDLSRLCDDFTRIWQRRLLQRFPLQHDLHQVHGRTLHAFIRQHRLGEETAQRIKATRQARPLPIPDALIAAIKLDITHLLEQIERLIEAIDELNGMIQQKLDEHPDASVFQSLPVKGTNTIATLLAGFGENREHAPRADQLAGAWGVAPLTIQSGKHRSVRRRHAADQTMNQTLLHFAFNTAFTAGCWAKDFYQRKRNEGKAHFTALRCLAQRWLKILHRMWKERVPYDEQLHRNNQQQTENQPMSTTPA